MNERPNGKSRAMRAAVLRGSVIKYLIERDDLLDAAKCPGPNDAWAIIDNPTPGDAPLRESIKVTMTTGDELTERAINSGWNPED